MDSELSVPFPRYRVNCVCLVMSACATDMLNRDEAETFLARPLRKKEKNGRRRKKKTSEGTLDLMLFECVSENFTD